MNCIMEFTISDHGHSRMKEEYKSVSLMSDEI